MGAFHAIVHVHGRILLFVCGQALCLVLGVRFVQIGLRRAGAGEGFVLIYLEGVCISEQ